MKYIDAEKLKAEIDNLESFSCISEEQDGFYSAISRINGIIDYLQQEQPEVFDTIAFQKGVQEGRRLEREDVKSTIQSRIDEILGDAQPAPILRMELQELIKKIEE